MTSNRAYLSSSKNQLGGQLKRRPYTHTIHNDTTSRRTCSVLDGVLDQPRRSTRLSIDGFRVSEVIGIVATPLPFSVQTEGRGSTEGRQEKSVSGLLQSQEDVEYGREMNVQYARGVSSDLFACYAVIVRPRYCFLGRREARSPVGYMNRGFWFYIYNPTGGYSPSNIRDAPCLSMNLTALLNGTKVLLERSLRTRVVLEKRWVSRYRFFN